jgi:hypothetical protein
MKMCVQFVYIGLLVIRQSVDIVIASNAYLI